MAIRLNLARAHRVIAALERIEDLMHLDTDERHEAAVAVIRMLDARDAHVVLDILSSAEIEGGVPEEEASD